MGIWELKVSELMPVNTCGLVIWKRFSALYITLSVVVDLTFFKKLLIKVANLSPLISISELLFKVPTTLTGGITVKTRSLFQGATRAGSRSIKTATKCRVLFRLVYQAVVMSTRFRARALLLMAVEK